MREDSLQRAQMLAGLGSWEWDLATGRLEFSEALYRLLGLQPAARRLSWRDYLRFLDRDDRHRVISQIRRALRGATFRVDHRVRDAAGQERWLHCEGEVTFDDAGCPTRMIGTSLDTTRERQRFDQLEGGARLFRALVENARDVIFRYRLLPEPGFDYHSPATRDFIGVTPEEIYADPQAFFSRVHPDDAKKVAQAIANPEASSPCLIRVKSRDGQWLWTEAVLVPIRDGRGTLVAVEGVVRNVTARKEAEAERERLLVRVEEERRWLEAVLEQAPGALLLIRRVGGVETVTANSRAEALLGKTLERTLSDPTGAPLPASEYPAARALRGEAVRPGEYLLRAGGTAEVPVLGSASPMRDPSGRVVGAVVLWEPLAAVKELERSRVEWTSMVAHDLRQPLTLIRSNAELLERQLTDERQGSRAAQIEDAARRLGRMIQDLLDGSRLEAHRLTLEKRPLELTSWLRVVIDHAVRQLAGARFELRIECAPVVARVDPDRLEQVLMNLLSNAVKYGTPGGPVEVAVRSFPGVVRVCVRNPGRPIASEDLPRLFGRFQRAAGAMESKTPGAGLGLYIARGLIEAHGGRIQAQSDPGGNTFWFDLPTGDSLHLPDSAQEHGH